MGIGRPVRLGQVDEIAAIADPVLRNLWITQAYHDFAHGLAGAGLAGGATSPAFAACACKTAGRVIRGEEIPSTVRRVLGVPGSMAAVNRRTCGLRRLGVAEVERRHLLAVFDRANRDVEAEIAGGNLLVFRELGPCF